MVRHDSVCRETEGVDDAEEVGEGLMNPSPEDLFNTVKSKLEQAGCKPKVYANNSLRSICPSHKGDNPSSLHVQAGNHKLLIHCHSGKCTYTAVMKELGIDASKKSAIGAEELICDAVRYMYRNEHGDIVGAQVRKTTLNGKSFARETYVNGIWESGSPPKSELVPYRLPEMIEAAKKGERIWIVEGEKDVETLVINGITATAFMGGSSGWTLSYEKWFRGTRVVICGDRDTPGQKFCGSVREGLEGTASEILIVDLPYELRENKGKDVSDFLANNSKEDLESLISESWRGPGIVTIAEACEIASKQQKVPLEHYDMAGMGPGYDLPGIGPGSFIGVVARLSTGKTAWIVDLCCRCIAAGKRVMFVSYDETPARIASYLAASITGDYTYISRDEELRHIIKAPNTCEKLKNLDLIIDGYVKEPEMIAEIAFRYKPDVVFVDHLAKILPKNPKEKDNINLGKTAAALRKIANEGQCSVVSALQSNREGRHGILENTNVAGSDDIAKEMDAMLGLQQVGGPGSDGRLSVSELLKDTGHRSLDSIFPKPIGELGMRLRPSIRALNVVKTRFSRGDRIWPVIFYGAERRVFPVHSVGCQCDTCSKRMITHSIHDCIVKQAVYGDGRDTVTNKES